MYIVLTLQPDYRILSNLHENSYEREREREGERERERDDLRSLLRSLTHRCEKKSGVLIRLSFRI